MAMRLAAGEHVIVRTRPNPRPLLWPFLGALAVLAATGYGLGWLSRANLPIELLTWEPWIVSAVLVVAGLLLLRMFFNPLLRWMGSRYILTSRRLIRRRGLARRSEQDVTLAVIYQLGTDQSLIQRATGSGTLVIDLGRDRTVSYPDVPRIHTFKEFIVAAISDLPLTVMFDGVDMEADVANEYEGEW
ncbi:PH domain-containing protein [Arthrobacter sp. H5]|uniref:PH domain-containing protein n=1 Tax=Arthrobacter sp. H5 TaxID=1267973 RepID=UPI000487B42F|nr:PH domain-containing protein [Arthrobacter sp. H5]